MLALSVREPWASLIREGKKPIETRTWKTRKRGYILICASLKPQIGLYGRAVATAELVDCRPMTKHDEKEACCEMDDGLFAWVLQNVKKIVPFPVKGQLGFFNVDCEPKEE